MIFNLLKKYDFYFALICICFALTKLLSFNLTHDFIRLFVFPFLIIFYFLNKNNNKFVLSFLVFFALAEISYYYIYAAGITMGVILIICNLFFVLGYISLIALIVSNLNLKQLLKRFPIQTLVLIVVGFYLFLQINGLIPFHKKTSFFLAHSITNIIYNLVIIVTLSLSLLHYFYKDSKTSLTLLMACATLTISEFFQVIYYYNYQNISEFLYHMIDKIYITLLAISYFIFFLYIKATNEKQSSKNDALTA